MKYIYTSKSLNEAFSAIQKDGHTFANSRIKALRTVKDEGLYSFQSWTVEVRRVSK